MNDIEIHNSVFINSKNSVIQRINPVIKRLDSKDSVIQKTKEEEDKDKADRAAKIERQKTSSDEGDTRYSDWY